ncbi:MAG: Fis family transcriptional regulator, partial [Pseudonocardia sp.]|nr:Fis family transcriptional regulator [Pseudonocardia sp.]
MRRDENPYLPTLSPEEKERTRRGREALVRDGLLTLPPGEGGVPQHIERSWRRCVGEQVPVAPDHIDYRESHEVLPVLRRAAMPVLDRLKDSFADVPVAMVLSDANGRIILRHAALRRQRDVMDRASAAEGFDFSERSIGTNGLGTVLVERRPVIVRGPEHYNALLENLTCAGTPIIEPYTGRMVGSFSLACAMQATRMRVPLSDGLHDAVVEPVHDGGKAAYSVRLLSRRTHGRPDPTVDETAGGAGSGSGSVIPSGVRDRVHFHSDVARQLEAAARHRELVALVGASGTGKLRTALRTLGRQGADDPLVVEPHLDPGWFAAARAAA